MNTAAIARPELLDEIAERFGRQVVVLSVDARRVPNGAAWRIVSTGRMDPRWRRYLAMGEDDADNAVFDWDDDSAEFAEPASA